MPILRQKEIAAMEVGQTYILPYATSVEVHNMRQAVSYAAEKTGFRIVVSKDRTKKMVKVSRVK